MASIVITGALELQQMTRDLMSGGKIGKKIFRKGIRAGAKVIVKRIKAAYPHKSGKAAASAKVKALKRSRGRIGVRVSVYAENPKTGFPYPMALEGGVKVQPRGGRVRKGVKIITAKGRKKSVTDEEGSKAYRSLTWRIKPRHDIQKAFDSAAPEAEAVVLQTWRDELEKVSVK